MTERRSAMITPGWALRRRIEFFILHAKATHKTFRSRDILGISQFLSIDDQVSLENRKPGCNIAFLRDCALRRVTERDFMYAFGMSWDQIYALQIAYEAEPEYTLQQVERAYYQSGRVNLMGVMLDLGRF